MKKNIFIEGMQGTGKSTLLNALAKRYPEYQVCREGDLSPAELAWCSYMTKEQWEHMLSKYPMLEQEIKARTMTEGNRYITAYTQILAETREFYEDIEQYEIYNGRVSFSEFHDIIMKRYKALPEGRHLFECSFLQNSMECMMLYYQMKDEDILAFYREAFEILREKDFQLLYLDSERVRENVLQIKKERSDENGNEMWYPLMLNYLKESPYGKAHGYEGLEDMIAHFERRRQLELRVLRDILGEAGVILKAREFAPDTVDIAE